MRSKLNNKCPYKRHKEQKLTGRKKRRSCEERIGIGVMQSEAKECLGPPEAGKAKEEFSPRTFRENEALQIP